MAIFYKEGEEKIRPGVYQRYSNVGTERAPGAQDGICAIPIQAKWGPLGVVVHNTTPSDLTKNYGTGEYGPGYTIPAAKAMFDGGATKVYTYRMGTGGQCASLMLKAGETDAVAATAKHSGTLPLSLSVLPKVGDSTKKEVSIYADGALVETFHFDTGDDEPKALVHAGRYSKYIDFAPVADAAGSMSTVQAASGTLAGGEDPTVTNEDYSKAYEALEPFFYNCVALDVDDDESLSKTLLLQEYLSNAYRFGKLAIAVVGEKVGIPFENRMKNARALNDEKVVYLGSGWTTTAGDMDGVLAICRTAGLIAATPANQGIVHTVISGATGLLEALTYTQYEQAIQNGMLLPSMSSDGSLWYDSGINTLVKPGDNQDDGWKKIRRTKTRFEMFDRMDRALLPKVGRVNCDSDGIGDVIQTGNRVLTAMADERKILPGAKFSVESYAADSAWFTIQADDIDSLEKIYLHYQFRFSQE